jgi:hypothetical protein
MAYRTGDLSGDERGLSGLYGVALALVAVQRGNLLIRTLSAIASAALLVRAVAGQSALEAGSRGNIGVRDAAGSDAIDAALEDSFPASDAPGSRLPDEPPVNAEAKWEAARGKTTNGGAV